MSHHLLEDLEELKISRRRILHAMGYSFAFFLPMLKILRVEAQANLPKRFAFIYTPLGTIQDAMNSNIPDQFFPKQSGRSFTFPYILKPLDPIKEKTIVIEGIHANNNTNKGGKSHARQSCMLTGQYNVSSDEAQAFAGGESLDHFLGRQASVINGTAVSRLNLGVNPRTYQIWRQTVTYSRAGREGVVPPITNPVEAFDRLFANINLGQGNGSTSDQEMQAIRDKKKSVLDSVVKDFKNLKSIVSTSEYSKIQDHMDAVQTIEREIANSGAPVAENCAIPQKPNTIPYQSDKFDSTVDIEKLMKLQFGLLEAAFKCDRTRVATVLIESENSQWKHGFLAPRIGMKDSDFQGHHSISHWSLRGGGTDLNAWKKKREIDKWYYEHISKLAQNLDAVNGANGSLLDQSVIWVGSGMGQGNTHVNTRIPTVLIGSAGGYFDVGQSVKLPWQKVSNRYAQWGTSHTAILASILQAMGVSKDKWGDPAFALPALKEIKKS